jgi:hypothetical protein
MGAWYNIRQVPAIPEHQNSWQLDVHHPKMLWHWTAKYEKRLQSKNRWLSLSTGLVRGMIPRRTEKVDFSKKEKTIKNRITKKTTTGRVTRKNKQRTKKNQNLHVHAFSSICVCFFLFALVLFFFICYVFVKRYILCVAGLRMLGSSPLFSGNKSESLRQLVTNKLECIKWGNIPISFVPVRCWNFRCGAIYCPQESVPNDVQTSSWWILMENFTIYLTTPDISHGKPSI